MLLVTDGDRFVNNTFDQQYFDSGYHHSSTYLPGSESQASFQQISIKTSSFNHLDTSQASKKVNRQSVAHTPAIDAVMDTVSLVNRVLDSIPGNVFDRITSSTMLNYSMHPQITKNFCWLYRLCLVGRKFTNSSECSFCPFKLESTCSPTSIRSSVWRSLKC